MYATTSLLSAVLAQSHASITVLISSFEYMKLRQQRENRSQTPSPVSSVVVPLASDFQEMYSRQTVTRGGAKVLTPYQLA